MKQTVLCLAAHNDDQIVGAGGALIKYAREGKRIRTVVFSYGELHLIKRKEVIIKQRMKECAKSDKIMGGSGIIYLGCRDGKIGEDIKKEKIIKKLTEIIKKEKPIKIFTHSLDDAHPDHRSVYRLVMKLIDKKVIKCSVYSFDVWSVVKFKNRNYPRLVVDISDTFNTKVKAFLVHESQALAIWSLLWKMIFKDWLAGLIHGYKYAEVFYRLK